MKRKKRTRNRWRKRRKRNTDTESEDENFGSFQEEIEVVKMEEVIYLKSTNKIGFSTNMFVLIDNVEGTRIRAQYSYVCGIHGVDDRELDLTGSKTTNLATSKFVSVENDQFDIFDSQL
ncbi:hypothetical protein AVEN_56917-1 [Araneus ventricosus]|uniref:Uncharacterized protein n=1 Tax=Araneus ventricosus TaxID=182803 RepID=A0A4Y2EUZ2_ARAVE|nr:hypothetical protein AVEN_56917-1 [Araneus ventricosus]